MAPEVRVVPATELEPDPFMDTLDLSAYRPEQVAWAAFETVTYTVEQVAALAGTPEQARALAEQERPWHQIALPPLEEAP